MTIKLHSFSFLYELKILTEEKHACLLYQK